MKSFRLYKHNPKPEYDDGGEGVLVVIGSIFFILGAIVFLVIVFNVIGFLLALL